MSRLETAPLWVKAIVWLLDGPHWRRFDRWCDKHPAGKHSWLA